MMLSRIKERRILSLNTRWGYGLAVSLICLLAVVIYSNTFQSPFVFDDQHTIQENAKIRDIDNFYTPDVLQSQRPLVDFTFALNYHFGKLRVFGYHLVNLLIHAANGIMVFFLSQMLFRKLTRADDLSIYLSALFAALIFTAHPLQTQAVTYISQRYTEMAALFYLGSVMAYIKARDARSATKQAASGGFFLVAAVCGALAFLCKQNSASLPLAILLVEYVCYDQSRHGWIKKLYLILPIIVLFGFFYAYNTGLFRHDIQVGTFLEDVSEKARETQNVDRWRYLCTQFNVVVIYIRLLVIPVQQNLDYVYPFNKGFFDGATPYSFTLLLGALAAGWWCRKKQSMIFLGVFWFFITLSVESSIIPIRDALFEHRLYLPMFGFSIIAGSLMERLFSKHRLIVCGVMMTIVISLSSLTYSRNQVWRNDVLLWSDVVQKNPSNYRGLTNLGNALMERGDLKGAMDKYDRVLQIKPEDHIALYNKGVLLERTGKKQESVSMIQKAIRIKPDYVKALINLGVFAARSGKINEAIGYFQKALTIQPQSMEANLNMATVLAGTGKVEPAVEHYLKVLYMEPDNSKAHKKVGLLLHILTRYNDAVFHYHESIRTDPNDADAFLNLGNSQLALNLIDEAVGSLKEAIRLNPKSIEAYINLGGIYLRIGNNADAIKQFDEVLKINPDSFEAHANLGHAQYLQGNWPEAMKQLGIAYRLKPDSKEILDNINKILLSKPNTGN